MSLRICKKKKWFPHISFKIFSQEIAFEIFCLVSLDLSLFKWLQWTFCDMGKRLKPGFKPRPGDYNFDLFLRTAGPQAHGYHWGDHKDSL